MKWFKHDADAALDVKLRKVRIKYGMEGYGLYWYLLECVARSVDSHNLTFELEEDSELISLDTGISRELVEDMMKYMLSLGLFEISGDRLTCLKMLTRTDDYVQKLIRNQAKTPTTSGQGTDTVRTKSGLIEQKRTEQKRTRGRSFTPPTIDEVTAHCREKGYNSIDPEKFISYYAQQGWKLANGNPMKCWRSATTNWAKRRSDTEPQAELIT